MKNKSNYSGLLTNTAIIAGLIAFACIEFFLKSNFFTIQKATTNGGLISALGVLLIIVVISALSISTTLLLKKYHKQNEN